MLHVERLFPHAYYAPTRWNTVDGYIPFQVCWAYFNFTHAIAATDALATARGIGLAFAGPDADGDPGARAIADAYPRGA